MEIVRAEKEDLAEILALQKAAYQKEAKRLNNMCIQPLTQTLEEAEAEFDKGIILKAVENGKIVGSVRANETTGGAAYIGKLMVLPGLQGQGIGGQLLQRIEALFPGVRKELFTSEYNVEALSLYRKNGYRETKREDAGGFCLVYMEKVV
jgi:ribosomal protein S18 acetylase RimI-like enzyme